MKFLFVNLDWPGLVSKKTYKVHLSVPPLDLVILSNMAQRNGHEAKIFDCFVDDAANLEAYQKEADWIIVATTPYHMWQCPNSEWEWICAALKRFDKKKVILTGLHASMFPERTLEETGVHAIIKREPEGAFFHFLQSATWVETVKPLPMDELAVTDYSVIDVKKYGYFLLGKRTAVFEASRGCPWKCTFCDQEMYNWIYREKSPIVFAEEVARAVRSTGIRSAYFYDLEFTINRARTTEICDRLESYNLKNFKWCCQTRADRVDIGSLRSMRDAGCRLVHFGVESANPEILKATNKKITLEEIEHGVALAKSAGLQTACFFMFGLPGEKPDEFENTLNFARKLNPTYASFHFAIPFPGTPLYAQYLTERNLKWGSWPATYFNGWSHKEITDYISRAYRKFYLAPRKWEPREFAYRLQNLPHKLQYFSAMA